MREGLGKRQTLMLQALGHLEEKHGAGAFYVWAVLDAAWEIGLRQEDESRRAQRKIADDLYQQEMITRAAQGDVESKDSLDKQTVLNSLTRDLTGLPKRGRRKRPKGFRFEDLNPARCFALLERRGLVKRYAQIGQGSSLALTDEGRAKLPKHQSA